MAIAFSCPQCGKSYKVKDELAGKPVNCKACTTPIRVPFQSAAPAAPSHETELLAHEALAESEQAPEAVATATVEFECPNCIENVKFDAQFAGKQAPCPNCRRIVRVPQLADPKARNWRAADHRPSLAKTTDAKLEGAWGNTTTTSVVSRDALAEADALRKRRPDAVRWPYLRWVVLGSAVVAALLGAILYRGHRTVKQRDDYMDRAVAMLGTEDKFPSAVACEVQRARGEYILRSQSRSAALADRALQAARDVLPPGDLPTESAIDRVLLLGEVAVTQAGLGGDKPQVEVGNRLPWNEVQTEMRRTLSRFKREPAVNEGITLAYERLARSLGLQGDDGPMVVALVASVHQSPQDRVEPLATVALEFIRLDEAGRAKAVELAAEVRSLLSTAAASGAPFDSLPAKVIALHVALGESAKLPQIQEPGGGEPTAAVRMGFTEGLARLGELDRARSIARLPGRFEDRFAAHAVLASLINPSEAQGDLSVAVDLLDKELGGRDLPEWPLIVLAQACARAPATTAGKALFESLQRLGSVSQRSQAVRAWALCELIRGGVSGLPVTEEIVKGIGPDHAAGRLLAWGALGRSLARAGSAPANVDAWPEIVRPVALAGIALGLQDAR